MEINDQLHSPAAVYRVRASGTHWIEGWVGPRAGLNAHQNICTKVGWRNDKYSIARTLHKVERVNSYRS